MQRWYLWLLLIILDVSEVGCLDGYGKYGLITRGGCGTILTKRIGVALDLLNKTLRLAHSRVHDLYFSTGSTAHIGSSTMNIPQFVTAKTVRNFLAIPYPTSLPDRRTTPRDDGVDPRNHLPGLMEVLDPDANGGQLWSNIILVCTEGDPPDVSAGGRGWLDYPPLPAAIAEKRLPVSTYRGEQVRGSIPMVVYINRTYYAAPTRNPNFGSEGFVMPEGTELEDLIESARLPSALLKALFELRYWPTHELLKCSGGSSFEPMSGLDCVLAVAEYGRRFPEFHEFVERNPINLQYTAIALASKGDFSNGTSSALMRQKPDEGLIYPSQPVGVGTLHEPGIAEHSVSIEQLEHQTGTGQTPDAVPDTGSQGPRQQQEHSCDAPSLDLDDEAISYVYPCYMEPQSTGEFVSPSQQVGYSQSIDLAQDHGSSQNTDPMLVDDTLPSRFIGDEELGVDSLLEEQDPDPWTDAWRTFQQSDDPNFGMMLDGDPPHRKE